MGSWQNLKSLWQNFESRLKAFSWKKWSPSAVVFFLCFVLAFIFAVVVFPPEDVRTPFGFVLAYSVFVGIICGLAAFIYEIIVRKEQSITQWKGRDKSFSIYITITVITPLIAIALMVKPIKSFVDAKFDIDSQKLGHAAKTGMVNGALAENLKDRIRTIDDVELGNEIAFVINERSNPSYKDAMDHLEFVAFSVVLLYLVADCVALSGPSGWSFRVMVIADFVVILTHVISVIVIRHNAIPYFPSFNGSMIQSFCGGLMGLALLAQCVVFGFILPLFSPSNIHNAPQGVGGNANAASVG